MFMKKIFIILTITFFWQLSFTQTILKGMITDNKTGIGIRDAEVQLTGTDIKTKTVNDGSFTLNVSQSEDISLTINAGGYTGKVITLSMKELLKDI